MSQRAFIEEITKRNEITYKLTLGENGSGLVRVRWIAKPVSDPWLGQYLLRTATDLVGQAKAPTVTDLWLTQPMCRGADLTFLRLKRTPCCA